MKSVYAQVTEKIHSSMWGAHRSAAVSQFGYSADYSVYKLRRQAAIHCYRFCFVTYFSPVFFHKMHLTAVNLCVISSPAFWPQVLLRKNIALAHCQDISLFLCSMHWFSIFNYTSKSLLWAKNGICLPCNETIQKFIKWFLHWKHTLPLGLFCSPRLEEVQSGDIYN